MFTFSDVNLQARKGLYLEFTMEKKHHHKTNETLTKLNKPESLTNLKTLILSVNEICVEIEEPVLLANKYH